MGSTPLKQRGERGEVLTVSVKVSLGGPPSQITVLLLDTRTFPKMGLVTVWLPAEVADWPVWPDGVDIVGSIDWIWAWTAGATVAWAVSGGSTKSNPLSSELIDDGEGGRWPSSDIQWFKKRCWALAVEVQGAQQSKKDSKKRCFGSLEAFKQRCVVFVAWILTRS